MNLIKIITRWCFIYLLLFSYSCIAKEWYFQPSVNFRTLYNDNIRLITDQNNSSIQKDAFGFISGANANVGVRTDRLNIDLNAAGIINRYISDFDLDSENILLNTYSRYKLNENNNIGLDIKYFRDSTLYSVLDALDTQENILRDTLSIRPEWKYNFSKFTSIRVDYNYIKVDYEKSIDNRFRNYTLNSTSLKLRHKWNNYIDNYANFSALFYDSPASNNKTTNYNFLVGMNYHLSDTWLSTFEIGIYNADNELINEEGVEIKSNSLDPLFRFKTKKSFEASSIEASYLRNVIPRGVGGFSQVDSSLLKYTHNLSDQWKFSLNARYNNVQGLFESDRNITVYSAGISVNWIIDPLVYLTTGYLFKYKEFGNNNNDTADSNSVFVSINYSWDYFSSNVF